MVHAMIVAFGVYCGILLSIGFYFYTQTKNESSFALGNRSLNYWLTAIAAQASDMSDWLFMGFPGLIYAVGFSGIWFAVGLVVFMWLTWQFIAPALRRQTEQYQTLTLSSFIAKKVNDSSHVIKYLSGIFCLYFFTFYIAAGILGLGKALENIFEIPYHAGIIVGLFISLLYTLMGGMLAVAWSNLLQGTFLLICIIFVPIYAVLTKLDGFVHAHQSLQLFGQDYLSLWPTSGIIGTILAILKWGPGYFGQPHILINFMSIDNPEKISKAKYVGLTWQILVLTAAIMVGVVGKLILFPELMNRELVFVAMVQQMFPAFFAGFILCSILAATVSTINIQSLISATLITQDLLQPLLHNKISEKTTLLLTRIAIFIIPTLSLFIAWNETYNVLDLVLYAFSGLGTTFGPVIIMSLYYKNLTKYAVIAGLISGATTAITWPLNHTIPVLVVGYIISIMTMLIVSNFSEKK